MKKIALLLLLLLTIPSFAQIKVACVGNSITYGAGIQNRDKNSYPKQLNYMLGDGYEVVNFGISARTLMKKSDLPYVNEDIYKQSLEYKPDIVVIKLGTNDLKRGNVEHLERNFYDDYKELILSYRDVNKDVRVLLCQPIRCYLPDSIFNSTALEQIMLPLIERLAFDLDCEIVNLYSVFDKQWNETLMPDKLHPSSLGATMVAKKVASVIENIGAKLDPSIKNGSKFNFHGYAGYDFQLDGVDCKFVAPKHSAKGNPWVIRARFWGHEPQLDIDLLERGFAITYCDVADLFGAPKAVKKWDEFYKFMTNLGMNQKVVLEGMSRGGLIVYNWAAKNPSKVACIYADAPVMDFMSWPVKVNWEQDVENMLKAYGFKNLDEAKKWRGQPIDHAKKLVKIPIIHVVGDVDDVVPVAENTAIFEQRFKEVGGEIEVIHKPNVGHHPHSLYAPKRLVEFILKACGMYQNPCIKAVPGSEYRSSAGWKNGAEWHAVADEISAMLQNPVDILLIGNSITQGFGGERTLITHKPGKAIADSIFAEQKWFPAGISGDCTQHVLWRLQNGKYGTSNPKSVVITIGINNLAPGEDPAYVAKGIEAVAVVARKEFPNAKIYILGALPAGLKADDKIRKSCEELHTILSKTKFEGVQYVNPTAWFVNANGSLKDELYSGDYLHLSAAGYKTWCEQINKMLNLQSVTNVV